MRRIVWAVAVAAAIAAGCGIQYAPDAVREVRSARLAAESYVDVDELCGNSDGPPLLESMHTPVPWSSRVAPENVIGAQAVEFDLGWRTLAPDGRSPASSAVLFCLVYASHPRTDHVARVLTCFAGGEAAHHFYLTHEHDGGDPRARYPTLAETAEQCYIGLLERLHLNGADWETTSAHRPTTNIRPTFRRLTGGGPSPLRYVKTGPAFVAETAWTVVDRSLRFHVRTARQGWGPRTG